MMETNQKIEQAKWLLERGLGWIAAADAKVGVVMALDAGMIGGLAAAFTASEARSHTGWCYFMVFSALGCLVIAMFCSAMAAIPRLAGPPESMIYFGKVAERNGSDFVEAFTKLTDENFLSDLTTQIHRNAQIAQDKHRWVRKSLIWSFLSVAPCVISMALLVKK